MKPYDEPLYKIPPISLPDKTHCQEKTLSGILMLLQKCSSKPKPKGFEDSILFQAPGTKVKRVFP